MKRKVRRGHGGTKRSKNLSLKIIGNNFAGLKGKKDSFENFLPSYRNDTRN